MAKTDDGDADRIAHADLLRRDDRKADASGTGPGAPGTALQW
jgi:hypothetical protein